MQPNRNLLLLALLMLLVSRARPAFAGDWDKVQGNFVAVWSDGDVTAGREFDNWRVTREEWDDFLKTRKSTDEEGKSIEQARFCGRLMFADKNRFIRVLRNINQKPIWAGPFVEMKNGDILPGLLTEGPVEKRVGPSRGQHRDMRDFVTVTTSGQFRAHSSDGHVEVQADHLARIVFVKNSQREITPGLVIFRDGRQVRPQSMRLEPGGLRLLLPSGMAMASWQELAEIHLPQRKKEINNPETEEEAPSPDADTLHCRLITAEGAVLTYPVATSLRLLYVSHHNQHLVLPDWTNRAMSIPLAQIVSQSYYRKNEIPLSRLPTETLIEESITGHLWFWRRDENVRGGQLASGKIVADLGIGMHAHSAVAFHLPERARSFSAWVGIDEAVGSGGCVRCKIYLDEINGKPMWSSDLLRGDDQPVRAILPDIRGAKRLILVVEFADEDHPADADPLDLRDEVSWLMPYVTVEGK